MSTSFKSKENGKLRLCAGCEVARYCVRVQSCQIHPASQYPQSAQCQKKDWPTHKAKCKEHQEQMAKIASLDQETKAKSPPLAVSHRGVVQLLPSELLEEMRTFVNKSGPSLFQASYNACDIVNHYMGWKQITLYVILERLPVVDPDSHPWSRFRIKTVEPFPYLVFLLQSGEEHYRSIMEKMEAEELTQEERGFIGVVGTMLACASPGEGGVLMHDMSFCGFRSDSADELNISPLWKDKLIETVEKASGRPKPTSGYRPRTGLGAASKTTSLEIEVD